MQSTTHDEPVLTQDVQVFGIVGGPGSGKGTQCEKLRRKFPIEHLSIGDVLRAEMARDGSPYADIIRDNMMAGRVGQKEITVEVLKSHITSAAQQGSRNFILDGFARTLEQCGYFEQEVTSVDHFIVLECSEETLLRLLLAPRDRFDDKVENVQRRIGTFKQTTAAVTNSFEAAGKLTRIDAEPDIDIVTLEIEHIVRILIQKSPMVIGATTSGSVIAM